ncbi:MAG: hypothetical protein JW871_02945 [Endomicrobiales bacterium]|nr:hypothetical protein [Endomicrobiales bacterium]
MLNTKKFLVFLIVASLIMPNTVIAKKSDKEKKKGEAVEKSEEEMQASISADEAPKGRRKKGKTELSDDQIIKLLDDSLSNLSQRLEELDSRIRRIAFYSLKVDRSNITLPLFRQIQGKIEAAFLQVKRPILIYAPEVKPLKIVARENNISFVSGFQSTEEIKNISDKLKLDGFLEGELYVTDTTLYLNLRIFETEQMSIVWSQELNSIAPPQAKEPEIPRTTGVDYGLGLYGIPVAATSSSTGLTIPSYAKYYVGDLRIAQKTITGEKLMFTLAAGVLSLYDGVEATGIQSTIVSKSGGLPIKFFARFGLRFSLIPAPITKKFNKRRDLLATEFTYGRLFGISSSGINTFGLAAESDITKNLSVRLGIEYIPITEVSVTSTNTVKVGGLAYDASILRINYKP